MDRKAFMWLIGVTSRSGDATCESFIVLDLFAMNLVPGEFSNCEESRKCTILDEIPFPATACLGPAHFDTEVTVNKLFYVPSSHTVTKDCYIQSCRQLEALVISLVGREQIARGMCPITRGSR